MPKSVFGIHTYIQPAERRPIWMQPSVRILFIAEALCPIVSHNDITIASAGARLVDATQLVLELSSSRDQSNKLGGLTQGCTGCSIQSRSKRRIYQRVCSTQIGH